MKVIEQTAFGSLVIVWAAGEDRKIRQVVIPGARRSAVQHALQRYPGASPGSCREVDRLARAIVAFLGGEDVAFALDHLAWNPCEGFQETVLRATHAVPRGRVTSYRLLAEQVGCPGGARAVGNVMAANPFPLVIPCHRVIRSDLTVGAYGGGAAMKRALLRMEGVIPASHCKRVQATRIYRSK